MMLVHHLPFESDMEYLKFRRGLVRLQSPDGVCSAMLGETPLT